MYKSIYKETLYFTVYWGRSTQGLLGLKLVSGEGEHGGFKFFASSLMEGTENSASSLQHQGQCPFYPPGPLQGDPTALATEDPHTIIHTTKALGPCHGCFQRLDGFLPAPCTTITQKWVPWEYLLLHKPLFHMKVF